jgi:hypothetical protein
MVDQCCPGKIKEAEEDWVEFIMNELKAFGSPFAALRVVLSFAHNLRPKQLRLLLPWLCSFLLATLGGFPSQSSEVQRRWIRSLLHRIMEKHALRTMFVENLVGNKA